MKFDPHKHHHRSIRLKEYDYSQEGAHFVTIRATRDGLMFGEIKDGEVVLNEFGLIVEEIWNDLTRHYNNIELDAFVVMPNHIHGIILIYDERHVGAIHELPLQRRQMLLPKIIGRFKMNSAKRINILRDIPGCRVWQRNYYEHIIRGEKDLNAIRAYIRNNPINWKIDEENAIYRTERRNA
jgi:putative transposase